MLEYRVTLYASAGAISAALGVILLMLSYQN